MLLTISYAGFFAPDHTLFECFGPLCMLTTAQEWRQRWIVFFNGINCLPVILERRKNAVGSREIKKCGKEWRIWQRIQVLNILTCVRTLAPIASQGSALPGQRRSVSLCFRVATLLKTQFACHRIRGKLTLRKKEFIVFIWRKTKNIEMTRTEKPSPLVGEGGGEAVGRGKCEQTGKKYLLNGWRTVYFSKDYLFFAYMKPYI